MNKTITESILANCDNVFGKLPPAVVTKIKRYLDNPTTDGWSDISTIVIGGKDFTTIRDAVMVFDDTFPKTGLVTDSNNNVIKDWERIPSAFELLRAIQLFTE